MINELNMPVQTFSLSMNTSTRQHLLGYHRRKISTSGRNASSAGLGTHSSRNWRASGDSSPVGTENNSAGESLSGTVEVVRRYLLL